MSLESAYLWLMLVAGGFLVLTFLIGEAGHGHHGIDSLLGSHDHDMSSHNGGDADHDRVSPFSIRNILGFLTFFGATGTLFLSLGTFLSLVLGTVVGLVGSWLIWKLTIFVVRQSSSSHATKSDFIGQTATVDVTIPAQGVGTVVLQVTGQTETWAARSEEGDVIPAGAQVVIRDKEGGTLIVFPFI